MVTFSRLSRAAVLIILLATRPGIAGEMTVSPDAVQEGGDAALAPSAEMLEFLGDWDTIDDEWVGPDFFETLEEVDQEQDHDQTNR